MRVYKTVEKQAKVFGLSISDFIGVVCVIFGYIIVTGILEQFGIKLGIWGVVFLFISVVAVVILLHYANKKKCPNYLFAISSYKYLQPTKILPSCPSLKASTEYLKKKSTKR